MVAAPVEQGVRVCAYKKNVRIQPPCILKPSSLVDGGIQKVDGVLFQLVLDPDGGMMVI